MKTKKSILVIFFSAALLCIFLGWSAVSAYSMAPQTQGNILFVKPGANGNCTSWAAACELQTALSNATTGDQIWVAAGTYKPTTDTNREATFQLESDVAIYGGFAGSETSLAERDWVHNITTLSGDIGGVDDATDNSYHVVTGSGADETTVLDGFTISGGNANGNAEENKDRGGGMYNFSGSPSLSNVTFSNNYAYLDGGGMHNTNNSSPSLSNVTFSSNSADYGGGMYNSHNSSPSLSNVTFSSNSADYGGGMDNRYYSSPSLSNVTFSSNSAVYFGGGMYNHYHSSPSLSNVTFSDNTATGEFGYGGGMCNYDNSSPSLSNVTFSDNTATGEHGYGGGMFNYDNSSPSLSNVTFSSNSVTFKGGGMYNEYFSSPILSNVTFSGNSATDYGGGMYNEYYSSPSLSNVTFSNNSADYGGGMYNYDNSSLIVTNSILWGNTPEQIFNDLGSVTVTYSDIQGNCPTGATCENIIKDDPLLGPLADNGGFTQTHALGEGSPAIDAGNLSNCPATDQRGFPRPIDGNGDGSAICDMGAYEYGFLLFLPVVLR